MPDGRGLGALGLREIGCYGGVNKPPSLVEIPARHHCPGGGGGWWAGSSSRPR